jgi:type IV pilus assembly protein PilE
MFQPIEPRPSRTTGFSLIELMVTVAIISILVAIAIPSYIEKVRKSRRTEAKTALLDLAGREERFFNTNNAYSIVQADLGYGTAGNVTALTVGSGYYQVTVTLIPAAPGPPIQPPGYSIQAVPIGSQVNDALCQSFTLDSTGLQTSSPSATDCWK